MASDEAPPLKVKPPGPWSWALVGAMGAALLLMIASDISGGRDQAPGTPYFFVFGSPGLILGFFSQRRPYRNATILLAIAYGLFVALFREGVVCLLFALPVFSSILYSTTFVGHAFFRWRFTRKTKAGLSILAILIQGGWTVHSNLHYDPVHHPWHEVCSSIAIAAPPATVFDVLTKHEIVLHGPWPAVLRTGLPVPQSMRVVTPGPGGAMQFVFNHGAARARIVGWEQDRLLAFQLDDIVLRDLPFHRTRLSAMNPDDHYGLKTERITDWLTFGKLEFRLEPLADGGTRLTRVTRYQRHLFPTVYFQPLQEYVMTVGAERLLAQLRASAESQSRLSRR